jgi:hypothetical protein
MSNLFPITPELKAAAADALAADKRARREKIDPAEIARLRAILEDGGAPEGLQTLVGVVAGGSGGGIHRRRRGRAHHAPTGGGEQRDRIGDRDRIGRRLAERGHRRGERLAPIGATGQYATRTRWLKCGTSRNPVVRFRITEPIQVVLIGAVVDVESLST